MKFSIKNLFYFLIVILIFILQNVNKCHGQPIVTIGNNTRIEGIFMITRKNRNISGFIGIKYAEPPIGKLRFSNPVLKELPEKYLLANNEGSVCTQMTRYGEKKVIGNEDCLFLNIYTPRKSFSGNKSKLLPVMVLIHGSAFLIGSSSVENLGPNYLLDKNIVYVSMNYRLDIFGFLSTGDNVALGNFGIKDQLVALQWIQKYIRHFGGDPNQVTLTGYSTGADSVNHHIFSNLTEGYFHRYIMQSGCPFSMRSYRSGKKSAEIAKSVAEYFNCSNEDSQLIVNCLRDIDYKKLINNSFIFPRIGNILHSTWLPTIEPNVTGAYIIENPFYIMKEKKFKNLSGISGIVTDEGLTWIAPLYVNEKFYNEIIENFDDFLIDIFNYFELTKNVSAIVSEVKRFYFKNEISNEKNLILKQLSDFLGDLFKNYPIIFSSAFYAKNTKSPLYFYWFNYRGLISMTNKVTRNNWNLGIAHTDELIYLYPQKSIVSVANDREILKNDSIITDLMVDLWTSFTINGVPTSEKLCEGENSWKPHQHNMNILKIGNYSNTETKMINSVFKERMEFWERIQHLLIHNFLPDI